MLTTIKDAIKNLPSDGLVYLAKKLSKKAGFFVSSGHLLYIVRNCDHESAQSISTEYLRLNTNVEIKAFADGQQFETGKYNILEYIPTEEGYIDTDLQSFVNLCSAHALYMNSDEFIKFFYSLINIFQYPAEQAYKNLIGLFGELAVIKFIYEHTGRDISADWHKSGSAGKYDFVFNKFNIEVKSSISAEKEAEIKHHQLFNSDNNYLAVVSLENNNAGRSTNQLIRELLTAPDYCNNYNFAINVEKERKRISPTDSESRLFVVKDISFYCAKDINPFPYVPNVITSLSYKLDLSDANHIEIKNVLEG